jgi:hypothetical protein
LASIVRAGARLDQTCIQKLLEDTIEALLGDSQNVEKSCDRKSGTTINEMQYPMVRATEAVSFEQSIGVTNEISIGKKEKLYEIKDLAIFRDARRGLQNSRGRRDRLPPDGAKARRANAAGRGRRFSM